MSEQPEYEVDGEVMISGNWYKIINAQNLFGAGWRFYLRGLQERVPGELVQDYRPPEKPEWFTLDDWEKAWGMTTPGGKIYEAISQALQEKYGDPPEA